ncbi:MAG: GxxExxY protein [Candidatus Omnitrophica bacterium]|nr:GxxExxY protein [Candidatus Omnitrophota bacterium]
MDKLLYKEESYQIRGACFCVWKEFGGAFKESVIRKALVKELKERGLFPEIDKKIEVRFKDEKVGVYVPDLVVNDKILIELKVKPYLTKEDERQFWYYLKASDYKLGFLINFGSEKLEIKRRIYDKAREKYRNRKMQMATQDCTD